MLLESVTKILPQPLGITDSPTFAGLTLTGLTQDRILFAGVGGIISDDSNFTWDGSAFSVVGDSNLIGAVTINGFGADNDFRVEGVGEPNALFVRGSDGFVGVGTNAPTVDLEISGMTKVSDSLGVSGILSEFVPTFIGDGGAGMTLNAIVDPVAGATNIFAALKGSIQVMTANAVGPVTGLEYYVSGSADTGGDIGSVTSDLRGIDVGIRTLNFAPLSFIDEMNARNGYAIFVETAQSVLNGTKAHLRFANNLYGVYIEGAEATVDNDMFMIYIENSTQTNADISGILYGLYIEELTGGDTGNYAISIQDNNSISFGIANDVLLDYDSGNSSLDIDLTGVANTDLRIISSGDANIFNIDGTNGTIGIGGTAVSGQKLTLFTNDEIYFRDSAISIGSLNDGHLNLTADLAIDINAPYLFIDKIIANIGEGGSLYLLPTDNAVSDYGTIYFGDNAVNFMTYDSTNNRLKIGASAAIDNLVVVGTASVTDKFTTGSINKAIDNKTNNYTMVTGDYCIVADGSSNTIDITLPLSPTNGDEYKIACENADNAVTLKRNGKLILGDSNDISMVKGDVLVFQYDSTSGSWW